MKKNKWIILAILVVVVIAVGVLVNKHLIGSGTYGSTIARLGMNSTAHLMCSCLFVSDRDEDFCREYAAIKQVKPWIRINWEEKIIDSRLFFIFSGKAQYVGHQQGCQIL